MENFAIAFLEAEVTLRKSIFLKRVELGRGRALTSDEQQEVLETFYTKAYEDSLARSREEILDLKKSLS